MSLKELTQTKHDEAETLEFSKLLLSGNITSEQYGRYLYQMMLIYNGLEGVAHKFGLLEELPDLRRTPKIYTDLTELVGSNYNCGWVKESLEYYRYLLTIANDTQNGKKRIMAHVYVRHMGDLYGGQMIAKKVPGSHKFYEFTDPTGLKALIRERLDDSMGDEANIAFDHAIKIMRAIA